MIKRIAALALVLVVLSTLALTSCSDAEPDYEWEYTYHPYYNRFKDDVPRGKIKVAGNLYLFSEIMVRDKDESLLVAACNSLATLYEGVMVEFPSENTVKVTDYSGFFSMGETVGERDGNVLTVQKTNNTGDYTYDIRIEIHKDKVLFIHNGHTYNDPGTYSTITFELAE